MRTQNTWTYAAALAWIAAVGTSTPLYAQRGGGNYDTATEVTFSGTVEEVRTVPSPGSGPGGMHLMVRSDSGLHEVHLGPVAFARSNGFEFSAGDALTVVGSKVSLGEQEVVLAREVRKSDQVLTLRDARGFPLWAGGRRGSP